MAVRAPVFLPVLFGRAVAFLTPAVLAALGVAALVGAGAIANFETMMLSGEIIL